MKPKPSDPEQELIDEIHDIHASAWATAAPPASIEAANERVMLDAMRKLSLELLRRGVTTAVMEGAYLMWWLPCLHQPRLCRRRLRTEPMPHRAAGRPGF